MAAWDYEKIAVAFEGDRPTGVNLREDASRVGHYHAIRDARSAARSEDRSRENPVIPDGGSRANDEVHQPSDRWNDVHDLCLEALLNETKDIELLAWLAEAAVRTNGIAALAAVLTALSALVEARFDALHSIGDETADKLIPLSGLNGSQDSDGTLIRPLRLTSLAPNQIYGRLSLWEFQQGRKAKNASALLAAFQQEFSHLDGAAFLTQRDAVESCYQAITEVDARLTALCGAEAPSFGRVRDVLDDLRHAYGELAVYVKLPEVPAAPAEVAEMDPDKPKSNGSADPAAAHGPIADREQAFRALLEIAAFFRRTEPHSSLPLALETLVRRGRMDFMNLLTELIPDDNQRQEMLTRAGIHATKSQDGS